ncbi:hypothetical protein DBR11_20055 [Pedobacter sp. HMWF019]|uniref:Gfo/Idh/MocA family protein n=1 Tax=Pedobacter sp. HMWF019 TaxID=2056856 RepID=UPI000D33C54B|nr:Gfo/Idh/MocA family oxidoreductase [Pedobacter sp. HMWF019]PTS95978.1 hypothetical protein DBR11_20055 [Pedobacter sp. HMWF019]
MYKVLVIGCGNIGAQYDKHTDAIQTHVKAWHLNPETAVSIFDLNQSFVQEISDLYGCEIVEDINVDILRNFDCVSICTPTKTHLDLLEQSFTASVKTIICEKPVSIDFGQLEQLKESYANSNSKVLVNYIRRFLPAFKKLREYILLKLTTEKITNISVRYQRGFINNCSHAFDLIEFLTDKNLTLEEIQSHNRVFDQFDYDPTLSLQAIWGDININVLGLSNVLFSHFEIDIFLEYTKISITNAGDLIEIYEAGKFNGFLQPLNINTGLTQTNCLKDYMKSVTDKAIELTKGVADQDNFLSSIVLNQKMLKYIKD